MFGLCCLQIFHHNHPKVVRDDIIPFNEYHMVCPRVLCSNIPEIIDWEQFDLFLDDLILYEKNYFDKKCALFVMYFIIKHEMDVNITPKSRCVHPGIHEGGDLVAHIRDGYRSRNRPAPALCKVYESLKTLHCEEGEYGNVISFLDKIFNDLR